MARKRYGRTIEHLEAVERAIFHLKKAREHLRCATARRSRIAVSRALKSVEGARRHAWSNNGECSTPASRERIARAQAGEDV